MMSVLRVNEKKDQVRGRGEKVDKVQIGNKYMNKKYKGLYG